MILDKSVQEQYRGRGFCRIWGLVVQGCFFVIGGLLADAHYI